MVEKSKPSAHQVEKVIALCNEMIALADFEEDSRIDPDYRVFCGALRDSAYKIRRLAKGELVRQQSARIMMS